MPSAAKILARGSASPFPANRRADYNVAAANYQAAIEQFSGSYIMAAAGYNAGPGRPAQWTSFCGDPRGGSTDPVNFIECIPFSETRNYVMRVMENMEIYRAKLNGGSTPLTISADLKRGAYGVPIALPHRGRVGVAASPLALRHPEPGDREEHAPGHIDTEDDRQSSRSCAQAARTATPKGSFSMTAGIMAARRRTGSRAISKNSTWQAMATRMKP